jgi:hypothetical protein
MPLLALPDDCLGVVASFLPACDIVLCFQPACKVLRAAVREDLVDEKLVSERPVIRKLLQRGHAAVRRAYSDLRREEGRIPSASSLRDGSVNLLPEEPRELDEFNFLFAVHDLEEQPSSPASDEGAPTTLDFVEVGSYFSPCATLSRGELVLPLNNDFEEGVFWGCVAFHVVVMDMVSGRVEKLMDAPSVAWEDDEMVSYDWATIQGQDGVRDDGSFPLLSPTLLWAGPDEGDIKCGAELAMRGGDAPTLYLGCMFCSDDADPIEGRNKDVMGAIAGLFM